MEPSIVPHNRKHQRTMGSPFISFIDLSIINEHYNCKALCNNRTSVKCERGGFPHPRDCQKCICPGGYGGARCTQRPEGCGKTVKATKQWNTLNDTLGEWWTEREDYSICHYWIEVMVNASCNICVYMLFSEKYRMLLRHYIFCDWSRQGEMLISSVVG